MKKQIVKHSAIFVTVMVMLSPVSALADSTVDQPVQVDVSPDSVMYSVSSEQTKSTKDYWTEEKIDEALSNPYDVSLDPSADSSISIDSELYSERQQNFQPVPPLVPSVPNPDDVETYDFSTDYTSRPTGKLLYTRNSRNYSCSASFVNSSSKKLLVTAAHCVHAGKGGGWSSNMTFIPNYGRGQQALPVKELMTFQYWLDNATPDDGMTSTEIWYDVGFAAIDTSILPDTLKKPAESYGAHGFGHSSLTNFEARIIGYPRNPGNTEIPQSCVATAKKDTHFDLTIGFYDLLKADCNVSNARGASGGPWLQLYDASTGVGWLNGVTSSETDDGYLYSTVFNDRIYGLYTDAVNSGM